MRREQIAARDDPDHAARIRARHDGQPPDVRAHHVIRRFAQRVLLVHDRRLRDDQVAHAAPMRRAFVSSRSRRFTTPSSTPSASSTGNPWCTVSAARVASQLAHLADGARRRDRHHVARDRVAHGNAIEKVRGVLRANRRAAARELLRHDRAAHEEEREQIRRAAAGEQRQKPHRLARRLEREDDRGEQRVRRAGEDRRHADERRDVHVDRPARRQRRGRAAPSSAPSPPPIVNNGASVPPDVPLPRYTDHEMNLSTTSTSSARPTSWPPRMWSMFT